MPYMIVPANQYCGWAVQLKTDQVDPDEVMRVARNNGCLYDDGEPGGEGLLVQFPGRPVEYYTEKAFRGSVTWPPKETVNDRATAIAGGLGPEEGELNTARVQLGMTPQMRRLLQQDLESVECDEDEWDPYDHEWDDYDPRDEENI